MRTVNIYALTRVNNIENLQRLERQMSERKYMLNIKRWEIDGLRQLVGQLLAIDANIEMLRFFYSFQMPKLGKEFDLLKISEDTIINIELKSDAIPDEGIKKQLIQNRYYLSYLGKNIRSYTYISKENRLVRLTNSERLIDVEFDILKEDIEKQGKCYDSDIEQFFKEEYYIISPLADSERFLNKGYFLTSQQKDIAKKIQSKIKEEKYVIQGFTGLPGTGKTLLLYDIAMTLSYRQKVCIFHGGSYSQELENLDNRLKRIDFFQGHDDREMTNIDEYTAVLVDEAHLMPVRLLKKIVAVANMQRTPVILSYASESSIADAEKKEKINEYLYSLEGYTEYKLTNRIRANGELSSFIQCLMEGSRYNHRKDYPSVSVVYANNENEAATLAEYYCKQNYVFIRDNMLKDIEVEQYIDADQATCIECEQVVMLMDEHFYYDNEQGLVSKNVEDDKSIVRNLFHGLNRAKRKIALIILANESVCDVVLSILQGKSQKSS